MGEAKLIWYVMCVLSGLQTVLGIYETGYFVVKHDQEFNTSSITPVDRYTNVRRFECAERCNRQEKCKAVNYYGSPTAQDDNVVCDLLPEVGIGHLVESAGNWAIFKEIDECASVNPCDNGGTCLNKELGYNCTCAAGYRGDTCDEAEYCTNNNPCQNGGTCESVASDFTCVCPSLWTGVICQCSLSDTFPGRVDTVAVSSNLTGDFNSTGVEVFVETDGDGQDWIVLMRRHDGRVDFVKRDWADYREGFGNLSSEFWLGNDNMHYLTNNGSSWTVRFDLESFDCEWRHAEYTYFSIDSEAEWYRLHIDVYSGDAGDSMRMHNGMNFTTRDADHDASERNCAVLLGGGWWYQNCHNAKLTGHYGRSPIKSKGAHWYHWLRFHEGLKYVDMKIRVV